MKISFNKKNLHNWHEKFAWLPTKVDDNNDKHTIVWFEKIVQRSERYAASNKKHHWTRYTKKAYFKKKLNGDFEKGPVQMDTNGESPAMAASRVAASNSNTT